MAHSVGELESFPAHPGSGPAGVWKPSTSWRLTCHRLRRNPVSPQVRLDGLTYLAPSRIVFDISETPSRPPVGHQARSARGQRPTRCLRASTAWLLWVSSWPLPRARKLVPQVRATTKKNWRLRGLPGTSKAELYRAVTKERAAQAKRSGDSAAGPQAGSAASRIGCWPWCGSGALSVCLSAFFLRRPPTR